MPLPTPLRLLQIAPRYSGRPVTGVEQRTYSIGAQLARHMHVTHIGFSLPGEETRMDPAAGRHQFLSVPRSISYRPLDLLRGALGPLPFSVLNYSREEMSKALQQLLTDQPVDIVLLEQIQMGGYLPLLRGLPNPPRAILCDWHNIESELLHRYADTTPNPARRLYARQAAAKLERYEQRFVNRCDMHIAVSPRDRDTLIRYGAGVPVVVIENGVETAKFSRTLDSRAHGRARLRLLFVGAMDYHANVDAVTDFAAHAWPEIHRCLPDVVFTIVGRKPGPQVQSLASLPGVEVTGTVPDVQPYYAQALAAVVPMRVAGGTRIKILEAMAAGVPVVSTARGAEGLLVESGVHCLLAETAEEMREAVVLLAGDGDRADRIAAAGRELVEHRYEWSVLGDSLAASLQELLEKLANRAVTGSRR